MKAHPVSRTSRQDVTMTESGRVTKRVPENCEQEMAQCFHKLKEMIPTIPHNRKLSKVALLQHVIDYILDLETTLDIDPLSCVRDTPLLMAPLAAVVERRPLVESTQVNTQQNLRRESELMCSPGVVKC